MVEIKLNKRYKYAGDIMPKLLEIGFDLETACDFLNSIKDADVVPKSEWISVDERLPETEGKYLVCTTNGNIGVGSFIDYYGKGTHLCFDCWAVTHWMPLPEPPKGE